MRRPRLTRRLTLQSSQRVRDDAGGFTTSWITLGEVWAQVSAGTGRDAELAGLTVSTVPYRIVIRATPAGAPSRPLPGHRLRDGERIFTVLAVTEADHEARYLTVFAREEEVTT